MDTEGLTWLTCIGFATHHPGTDRPWRCLVVDTLGLRGQPHAGEVWSLLRALLESKDVEKVAWFALHEREFLQLAHGITLRGYQSAEMLFHERWPELPKSLKFAASILTRLPCWTEGISWSEDDDRPAASGETLFVYNGHDCISTLMIWLHPQIQELLR